MQRLMAKPIVIGFWILGFGLVFGGMSTSCLAAPTTLFPTHLPNKQWTTFEAAGFSQPACGVIYRTKDHVGCGMPLGGIDTGCLDLETSGLLGYSTIFNTHVPRRGPINLPILGLNVGGTTWVLCDKQPKLAWRGGGEPPERTLTIHDARKQFATKPELYLYFLYGKPVTDEVTELPFEEVKTAKEIHYWGHYPVADMEFETDAPVQVGLRAWSPFFPGETRDSALPGIVFEVHLRNATDAAQTGTVVFSFPGPDPKEAGCETFVRKEFTGGVHGIEVRGKLASYAVGVLGDEKPRLGSGLDDDGEAWARIDTALPDADADQPGSSAALDFTLAAGQQKIVRFVLTWCAPTWNNVGYNWATRVPQGYTGPVRTFEHMYAKYYPDPVETARLLAKEHGSLLQRVLAWQQVIYTEASLPVWLRESLVNMLHLIAEDGMWAQAKSPLPDWVKEADGLFGLNECPRECPQIECIPCSFYGNIPLVYFFPDLALSTLRGYKGYQDPSGAAPWIFGGCSEYSPYLDFARPSPGYQVALNSCCYVDLLDRYLMCHGTKELLEEFYPSMKKAVLYTMDLNRGPDGVVSMPDRKVSVGGFAWETEWFELIRWSGIVPHVGGIRLAVLRMAERLAEQTADGDFAEQCRKWFAQGRNTLDTKMWTGKNYLCFWDEKAGTKSDLIFGYQLDGEWMARWHGLPGAFRPDRVRTTLETIKEFNIPPTKYGAVNFILPDKTMLKPGAFPLMYFYKPYDFFVPEVMMLGMTYMYNGQKELGLELTRRCMNNIVCEQGATWDMPNIILGDTGNKGYGSDYYQNMMLWALPAAMENKSLEAPCQAGGLVDRVLKAARRPAK